jgi:lactoylglutathione lyase
MRFGHVALRIKDIDKMLDFYCDKLGLNEAFRINNEDGTLRIVYLHISNYQYLELCLGGETKKEFDDKFDLGVRHISFIVDDIIKTKTYLEEKGVVFETEILKLRDNNLTVFLFDPEGNKLEIVETKNDSPHFLFKNRIK